MRVCDRRTAQAGSHQASPGEGGGNGRSSPSQGKKGGAGGELGSSGSGAAVLRGVEEGQHAVALHRGCTLEPPGRAYQSQCLSHTLTPVRSEPGGGVGGGVQGISIF